ncbi:MAG TPA: hypothetical protein VK698_14840 [Kofleriaceae bacterium]|nr:hypothetical protein [Kofleriaceae bacterium]
MALAEVFADAFCAEELQRRSPSMDNKGWTAHLSSVVAALAARWSFYGTTKAMPNEFGRSEYFTLDAVMMERGHPRHDVAGKGNWVTFPMPCVTMEFENEPIKILYDYWKLLCVRSSLRVLAFIVGSALSDAAPFLKELTAMRLEQQGIDGEDLLLLGTIGMASNGARFLPLFWRQGAFAELRSSEQDICE